MGVAVGTRPAIKIGDLLFGCGVWYLLALGLFLFFGADIRLGWGGIFAPIAMMFFGIPHHGATLVRVYEHRADRRAYRLFSVYATILIWGAFVVAVHDAVFGSLMMTIFLTWSPWHYTAQNYGIALMFLGRAGVTISRLEKRLIYSTFILSYALAFASMHTTGNARQYSWVSTPSDGYQFLSLGLPYPNLLLGAITLTYAGVIVAILVLLLRRASLRAIAPTAIMMLSQAFWFSLPVIISTFQIRTGFDGWEQNPEYYFLWVGMAHAIQYLWITHYYAKKSSDWSGSTAYFAKAFAAGAAIWTVPSLIFAPEFLGRLTFGAGLGELIGATVNLHHFVLDGAIWKLRNVKIAKVLIRGDDDAPEPIGPERHWIRPWIRVVGALSAGIIVMYHYERYFNLRLGFTYSRLDQVEASLDRLAWIGRDSERIRTNLAGNWHRQRNTEAALRGYARAAELQPSAQAWRTLGEYQMQQQMWNDAIASLDRSLERNPLQAAVLRELAQAWLALDDRDRAAQLAERALALRPDDPESVALVERVAAGSGAREPPLDPP